jgi:predicted GIY-YIG superfamily endonuclease
VTDDELPEGPGVYIVHLSRPIRHARNYLGSAKNLRARIRDHRSGNGSPLLAEANRRGIDWHVSRIWRTRSHRAAWRTEIHLKNRRDTPKMCPDCTPGTRRAAKPRQATRRTSRHHPPVRKQLAAAEAALGVRSEAVPRNNQADPGGI